MARFSLWKVMWVEWRKVNDFPMYSVSDHGDVRNDVRGKILKPHVSTSGYHCVQLADGKGGIFVRYIHRLVGVAFLTQSADKPQIDHRDGNKLNNHLSNLRWVSVHGNNMGCGYAERIEAKHKHIKATHNDGREMVFPSRLAAADFFRCNKSCFEYGREYVKGTKRGWRFEICGKGRMTADELLAC